MPGSVAGPPVGSPEPVGAQGWSHRSGAPGRCGPDPPGDGPGGAGLPGDPGRPCHRDPSTAGSVAAPGLR